MLRICIALMVELGQQPMKVGIVERTIMYRLKMSAIVFMVFTGYNDEYIRDKGISDQAQWVPWQQKWKLVTGELWDGNM